MHPAPSYSLLTPFRCSPGQIGGNGLRLRLLPVLAAMVVFHLPALANDPPVITMATNQAVIGMGSAYTLAFTATDAESKLDLESLKAISLNDSLVPNSAASLMLWGSTNAGSFGLTIVPTNGNFGTAPIDLIASDGENVVTNRFVLQVTEGPPNPPQLLERPIDGLLGWWQADHDARDALGLHPGTLMNGAGFGPGTLGEAFDLDGEDDYVEIRGSGSAGIAMPTIEAWIRPASIREGKAILLAKGVATGLPQFELSLVGNSQGAATLHVEMDAVTNFMTLSGTSRIPSEEWTHVAVTVGFYGLKLYVNGELDASLPDSLWMTARPEDAWWIGKGNGLYFHGRVDEMAWYERTLSAEQLRNIYEVGRTGRAQPQILRQPQRMSAGIGSVAVFSVAAASPGGLPLSYQWKFNGQDLPGATDNALRLENLQLDQSGMYQVAIRNEAGSVTSAQVDLAVAGLIAWGGGNWSGELNVPKDLMNVAMIAVGGERNLALRSDGTLFCWGGRLNGVLTVPLGVTNLLSMATFDYDTYLVYPNKEVMKLDLYGNVTATAWTDVTAASMNGNRCMLLKADGTVLAWNSWNGGGFYYDTRWLTNAVGVAAGANHCLALRADGTVAAFGADIQDGWMYGQTNVPAGLSNVVSISASYYHNLALKADGTVVAWGGYLDRALLHGME